MAKLQPIVLAGDRDALAFRTARGASRGTDGIRALLHDQRLIARNQIAGGKML